MILGPVASRITPEIVEVIAMHATEPVHATITRSTTLAMLSATIATTGSSMPAGSDG